MTTPPLPSPPAGDWRSNLRRGVGLGFFVATALSLWATVLLLASGSKPFDSHDTSYGAVIGLYYAGGIIGGLIIGLAWPLRRYLFGAALLGILGVFPLYLGAGFLLSPPAQWLTLDNVVTAAFLALLVGSPVGMATWFKANPPPRWVNALLFPTAATVPVAWLVAIVVSGGSLFLTRWTGSWPPVLVILIVLGLFALPIGVALFVTLRSLGGAKS